MYNSKAADGRIFLTGEMYDTGKVAENGAMSRIGSARDMKNAAEDQRFNYL